MKLLDIMTGPWAIVPSKLTEIQGIYEAHRRGPKIDLKAVEASIGRPLANEHQAYEVIDGTAVIPVTGVLGKGMSLLSKISGGTSTALLQRDLADAIADPTVHAIVLQIDSPGGTVDGTQELAEAVFAARASGKPIIALADGCMCSAAYWIGSAAEKVYITSDTTQVGSIGVVASHVDVSKAEESWGRKTTEITAGKYKRVASQYGPLSEEGRATIQDQVDHIYSVFVEQISRFRAVAVPVVLTEMADGRVFLGQQAIQAGLADGVSSLRDLVSSLARGVAPVESRAGVAQTLQPNQEASMPITREQLQAEAPELLNTLLAEGAASELTRIKGVLGASLPGHEDLINQLAFDGKTTPGDAALAVTKAERKVLSAAQESLAQEAPKPVQHADPPAVENPEAREAALPLDQQCKARWDRDPAVRDEFATFGAYLAFKQAEAQGQIRILTKKSDQ